MLKDERIAHEAKEQARWARLNQAAGEFLQSVRRDIDQADLADIEAVLRKVGMRREQGQPRPTEEKRAEDLAGSRSPFWPCAAARQSAPAQSQAILLNRCLSGEHLHNIDGTVWDCACAHRSAGESNG